MKKSRITIALTDSNELESNFNLNPKQKEEWKKSLLSLRKSFEETDKRAALAKKKGFKTAAEILDFIINNGLIIPITDCANVEESDGAEDRLHKFLYE